MLFLLLMYFTFGCSRFLTLSLQIALKMKPKANGVPRVQMSKSIQGEGPNWILIAGGALLSTLSMRLGYKLKQVLDKKQVENNINDTKGCVVR